MLKCNLIDAITKHTMSVVKFVKFKNCNGCKLMNSKTSKRFDFIHEAVYHLQTLTIFNNMFGLSFTFQMIGSSTENIVLQCLVLCIKHFLHKTTVSLCVKRCYAFYVLFKQ